MAPRIVGTIWAIRITATLTSEEEAQFKIPNTVCVYHGAGTRSGKLQEKPHYHLFYDSGDETTKLQVQRMVKSNEIVKKYFTGLNTFYAIDTKPQYTLETYWEYVWRGNPIKKQRLVWWDIAIPQMPIPEATLIVADVPLDVSQVPTVIKASKPKSTKTSFEKQQMFYEYCVDYYEGKPHKPRTKEHICYLLVKYCANYGFTPDSSLSTWSRYAWINICEKPERKFAAAELARTLAYKFF